MTLDHIGIVFGAYLPLAATSALYALGGLTFPIMAYLLCEGYRHTRNVRKYALRLFLFGLLTQLPYMLAIGGQLNIMFTLLLGLLGIIITERLKSPFACVWVVIALVGISVFCDWGLMGVPMVLLYYYTTNEKMRPVFPVLVPLLMMGANSVIALIGGYWRVLPQLLYVLVGCTLTVPLLQRYNGQRGRPMKYFFYLYYALHLAALGLVRGFVFGNWGALSGLAGLFA